MTAPEIAALLLDSCGSPQQFESYMFGSILLRIGEDIDILIVGPGGDALSQLKGEIHVAGANLPLHILYLLPSEADRTEFVKREKCVPLAQLARSAPRPD